MIFYEHIKGLKVNDNTKNWTSIEFGKKPGIKEGYGERNTTWLPTVKVHTESSENEDKNGGETDLGYLVTNNVSGIEFKQNIIFREGIEIKALDSKQGLSIIDNNTDDKTNNYLIINYNGVPLLKTSQSSIDNETIYTLRHYQKECWGDTDTPEKIILNPENGSVTAQYMNTTSDRRAKTNIKKYEGNATEFVKAVPIYTYNYLSDNEAAVGMMAQDLQILDNAVPNFSFVSNQQATGENGDYMTIKESRLIYVLWKAVQEQAKEIEELKAKLK